MPSSAGFGSAGEKAGMAEHRFFHQRVARADRDAMAARDAARFADRRAAVPQHARMRVFPADRKRLVHLHILTRLDAPPAENALVRIVAIERIGVVDLDTAWAEREYSGARRRAASWCCGPCNCRCCCRKRCNRADGCRECGRTPRAARQPPRANWSAPSSPRQRSCRKRGTSLPIHLDHAGVAGLDRAKLRVITDLRQA